MNQLDYDKYNKKYYFITVFHEFDENYGISDARCWGFYEDWNDAREVVENNITDIWETVYWYAVIEEYTQGISTCTLNRWFYKYDRNLNKYIEIKEPEYIKHFYSFAIG